MIVISHRPVTLNTVDKILVVQAGMVRLFGSREEVMAKLGQPAPKPVAPPTGVASLAGERAARQIAAGA